jgi:hypothetical protein
MTAPSSKRVERSGPIRSSHTPLIVLVMSRDGERRNDWSKTLEREGLRVIRCAGPQASTCALAVQRRCPLHDEADFIFYDQASVTPELERDLKRVPIAAPIAFAISRRTPEGRESPVATRIVSPRQR